VPFLARTHGFASDPDVIVAAMIARCLGVEHVVTEPRPPAREQAPEQAADEADLLARLRSAVLVSDGMLSAFENVGRPDPVVTAEPVQTGGHGGELLRGGYAPAAWSDRRFLGSARAWSETRGAELFRRMATRRLGLLHPAAAGQYLASLAPFAAALPRGPLRTLDDFYLVNRAGRWSAAARQGYLLREPLVQPFFGDQVVRAARAVPLPDRITDRLHRGVLEQLCPELLDLPLAGSVWKSGPRIPPVRGSPVANTAATTAAATGTTAAARLHAGSGCHGRDVRPRPADGGRARTTPSAAGLAGRLGPGHPSHAAVPRLAERPGRERPRRERPRADRARSLTGGELSRGRSGSQPARRTPLPPRA